MAHNDNRYPHGTNNATGLNHGGATMFILIGSLVVSVLSLMAQGKIPRPDWWPF